MKLARALLGAVITFLLFLLGAGASAQTTVLSEGFEGSFPGTWSVGDANSTGTSAYWGKVDLRTSGSPPLRTGGGNFACYCAGIGFGGSALSPTYQNSMSAFVSRSVNLAGFSTATLSFWYIIPSMETGLFPPYELFRVKVDGTNIVFSQGTAQSGWTQANINLNAYVGGTHTLTFEFTSDGTVTYEGAYIDDILLVGNDPNDQISEATSIGAMTQTRTFTDQLNSPTDVDMVSFTVSAGQRISFDIDRPSGSTLDSVLRLFDSSGNQLPAGFNDDGRGPGEPVTFESYLEYSFTNSGTFYVGVSSYPNTNYSSAAGTNDATGSSTGSYVLVVSPGLAGTVRRDGGVTDYALDIVRTDQKAIDPSKRTWVVIHGRGSSRTNENIAAVATSLALALSNDQVLTLDWKEAASYTDFFTDFGGEDAIQNVGIWAAATLLEKGFTGTNLNLVGHSWGSYVADELAERIPGGVNTITALDAAENAPFGYSPETPGEIDFGRDSRFSWAFHSDGTAGSNVTPPTADEAFIVNNSDHNSVVFLFAYLVMNPNDFIGRYFALSSFLAGSPGPWVPDQYTSSLGIESPVGGYEAILAADSTGRTPTNIYFMPTLPNLKVSSVSTLTISNNEAAPLLGKGTDFRAVQAGSNGATNYFTLSNSGGTSLQIQSVVVPTGFQIVASPATPVPWAQSTTLGIRFAPSTAGTFSGNVFITNNTLGSSPFRFAITGAATNPLSAPVISLQPASQFGVAGGNLLLSVSVTGTTPLFYQWQKNEQVITDATNSTLNLTNLVRAAGGTFSVFVTNQLGTATSSNATVRVLVPQRFSQAPVRLGNGQVRLVFGDPVSSALTVSELTNFVVEATTNVLSTNWVRYTNGFSILGGMVQFDDPDAPASPRRFYRVIER